MNIPPAVRRLVDRGRLAHLVTLDPDGAPQVTCVWVGIEDDEIVSGHLSDGQRKIANMRRDPRVAISIEAEAGAAAMTPYVVLHGRARITDGGGRDLLARLADTYLGPGSGFVRPDMPEGFVTRVAVERITGMGEWSD